MDETLRLLVVEDSEDDALLIVHLLSRAGYEPRWRRVDTPDGLTAALDADRWDIVLADHSMPLFSGVRALEMVRKREPDMPFIFVSGTMGEDAAVAAMKAGAQDYVMKGNLKRLLPAVERELREARLRRERRRVERELHLLEGATRAAVQAPDVPTALATILEKMCEGTQWTLAQVWLPRNDGTAIECSSVWQWRGGGFAPFRESSLSRPLMSGEGLPGRVWQTKRPLWVRDFSAESTFPRVDAARRARLHAAVAIPVLADNAVIAVIEFFTRVPRDEDERLVQLYLAVAAQLGSIIQRKRTEERLHRVAHYDDLTGLPNRVLFTERLREAIAEADRHERLAGVVLLDLDRFKTINDSLGHGVGDLLLQEVSERLRRCVRSGDTVGRLAGDEFTIVLADVARPDQAATAAKKILQSLSRPFHIDGAELFTGASIGMTLYPTDEKTLDGLLRNADIAMYRAKEEGGNTYQFYSADMTVRARERLELENALRRALERDEFVVHYQPIVSLQDGAAITLEALVRWNHPQRGLLAPAEFISVAEETGLIIPLGEWVLRAAIDHGARMVQAGFKHIRIAVNLSAHQFCGSDLGTELKRLLALGGAQSSQLQLEITESVLMQDCDASARALNALSEMDVPLALDDFGTGYSSLSYLKRFPIDTLKIDRSFVRDIPDDADDSAIASAIISMAHTLGMRVVAEGVETSAQLGFLRERGCDSVQGHFISHPKTADEIMEWLKAGPEHSVAPT